MCEDCWSEPVSLIRKYPKNKVTANTTPAEYLENWDIARGLYDLIDKSSVQQDEDRYNSPVVGYYTEYRGSRGREYSQPMYTFKPAGDECHYCTTYPEDERHPAEREWAHLGCECGNIAYPSRDCPAHPLPSVDSRWVRFSQAGCEFCNHCKKRLDQEVWDRDMLFYCDVDCKTAYDVAYQKRMEEWRKKMG